MSDLAKYQGQEIYGVSRVEGPIVVVEGTGDVVRWT